MGGKGRERGGVVSYLLFHLVLAKIKSEAKFVRRNNISTNDAGVQVGGWTSLGTEALPLDKVLPPEGGRTPNRLPREWP